MGRLHEGSKVHAIVRGILDKQHGIFERQCLLAFDDEALDRRLNDFAPQGDAEVAFAHEAGTLWLAVMRGQSTVDTEARARVLYRDAAAAKLVLLSIEATTLQAMAALGRGDVEAALATARRASRMARTEALPEAEHLANLVLARVRRHDGKPHLAVRILASLARLSPPLWHAFIAWELLLAGGLVAAGELTQTLRPATTKGIHDHSYEAVFALTAVLGAARDGQRNDFDAAAARLQRSVARLPDLAFEATLLTAALDASATPPDALKAWASTQSATLPLGLHGASPATPEQVIAFVVVHPQTAGRRILRAGLALAAQGVASPDDLTGSAREHFRTDTALAILAAAGEPGLSRDVLFQTIYGIAYAAGLHEGTFRVLVHRMRKRIEGFGEVLRDDDHFRLRVDRALIIPDPRCAQPTEDAVLRLLASRGAVSSEEIASELRVSVRAAQSALKQLMADGACSQERQGRQIQYRVDDTTFSEPTPYGSAPTS